MYKRQALGNEGMADTMGNVQDAMSSISNIGQGFAKGGIVGGIAAAAVSYTHLFFYST